MPKSHPPTLITLAQRTLSRECGDLEGARILLALSGGPDSQALVHVLARLAPRHGLELFAHGVDHGLRPEAAAELDLAAELCRTLGVPFERTRVRVGIGSNLQARARSARQRALAAAKREVGATLVATAHHADDRAETVILRLLRGTGLGGLAVLPARDGDRIRPFIRARRRDIELHVARHRLAFATDPSNRDRRFVRVRVREEVMPLLESLSPNVVFNLNALADELAEPRVPPLRDARGQPVALGRAHVTAIRKLVSERSPTAEVLLPGGRSVRWDPATESAVVVESRAKAREFERPKPKPFRKRR
jgi:tRNA(Ile)-lysidine synthase